MKRKIHFDIFVSSYLSSDLFGSDLTNLGSGYWILHFHFHENYFTDPSKNSHPPAKTQTFNSKTRNIPCGYAIFFKNLRRSSMNENAISQIVPYFNLRTDIDVHLRITRASCKISLRGQKNLFPLEPK